MSKPGSNWTDTTPDAVAWAKLPTEIVTELLIATPPNPDEGMDRILLARFDCASTELEMCLHALDLQKPLDPDRRTIPDLGASHPVWWRPYSKSSFAGGRSLANALGREVVATLGGDTTTIFVRTYEM